MTWKGYIVLTNRTEEHTPTTHPTKNKMKTTARNIVSTLLITLTALAISATASAANLITNGSFELGPLPAAAPNYPVTYTAPEGWYTVSGDTQYGPASTWGLTPPDGTQLAVFGGSASFEGGTATSEDYRFSLTQGQQYTFSFDATGVSAYTAGFSPVAWEQWKMGQYYTVRYKGGALNNTTAVEGVVFPVAINNWTTTSVNFTAAQSGFATVEVFTYNNGWAGNVAYVYSGVDNFVLQAVPEPSTYALVLGGIATLLLIRRRVQA
jgi:hypothetical protein